MRLIFEILWEIDFGVFHLNLERKIRREKVREGGERGEYFWEIMKNVKKKSKNKIISPSHLIYPNNAFNWVEFQLIN